MGLVLGYANRAHMKRRNFILGGGALFTISGSLTVTSASFADSVRSASDFRAIVEEDTGEFPGTITIDDNTANVDTRHEWDYEEQIELDADIDTIAVEYPTGTDFDAVGTGDVTVLFRKSPPGDLREVTVNSVSSAGSSATFDIDPTSIDGDAIVEMDQVNNPDGGTYDVEMSFASGDDEITAVGEIGITSEGAEFMPTITNAPVSVSAGDEIVVDYEVENTGDESGSELVEWIVDGTREDSTGVTLDPDETNMGSFSYTASEEDPTELEVTVAISDKSATETVTVANSWSIELSDDRRGKDATHTWSTGLTVFDGEIDTITTEYPDTTEFDGLDQSDITVELTTEDSGTLEEINLAPDTYSGATATFDLNDTDTTLDGEARLVIEGINNPDTEGDYEATITLDGTDDTISATVSFTITRPGGGGGGGGPPGQQ